MRHTSAPRTALFASAASLVLPMLSCVSEGPSAPGINTSSGSVPSILTSGATIAEDVAGIDTAPIAPDPSSVLVAYVLLRPGDDSPATVEGVSGGGVGWGQVGSASRAPAAPRRLAAFAATGFNGGPLTISFPRSARTGVLWAVVELSGSIGSITPLTWPDLRSSATASRKGRREPILVGFGVGTASPVSAVPPARSLGQATLEAFSISLAVHWSRSSRVSATWPDPAHAIAVALELDPT